MDTTRHRGLRIALTATLAALPACIDDDPPSMARVVVDAEPTAPLVLVVSTHFTTRSNEEGDGREAVPLDADTVRITGAYDEEFDIVTYRRLYVLLRNDDPPPEQARMRVFLDGLLQYDRADEIADGEGLEFIFTSTLAY